MELGSAWKARSNNRRSSNLLQRKNPWCVGEEGEATMVASKQASKQASRDRETAQALFFSLVGFLWMCMYVCMYVCK